jgi:hypothetical protein
MAIQRVADDEQAIAEANATEYGLGSTVFSRSPERARAIAERLIAGSTVVNDFGLAYMANALPFGGVRGSGFGRLNGREGIRAMCNVKSVMEDRFPLHRATKVYPVQPGDYARTRAALGILYRHGLVERLVAGVDLVGMLLRRG